VQTYDLVAPAGVNAPTCLQGIVVCTDRQLGDSKRVKHLTPSSCAITLAFTGAPYERRRLAHLAELKVRPLGLEVPCDARCFNAAGNVPGNIHPAVFVAIVLRRVEVTVLARHSSSPQRSTQSPARLQSAAGLWSVHERSWKGRLEMMARSMQISRHLRDVGFGVRGERDMTDKPQCKDTAEGAEGG
jgi:hypothetical protein